MPKERFGKAGIEGLLCNKSQIQFLDRHPAGLPIKPGRCQRGRETTSSNVFGIVLIEILTLQGAQTAGANLMPNSRRANHSRYVKAQGKQLGQKLTSLHTGVRTVYNPSIIFSEARRGTRCADIQPSLDA
jgi:hypothetical protein